MSGGLEHGYQEVGSCPVVRVMDVMWSEYVNPSGVIIELSGGLMYVQIYI